LDEQHPTRAERIAGCLLGGAVGDMLGAPIEFLTLEEIRQRFGHTGLTEPREAYGVLGAITDDTQMTLFTAEGILRGHNRFLAKGIASASSVVRHAYKRWLHTQGGQVSEDDRIGAPAWPDGWLIKHPELHARRAPNPTCLSALADERVGSVEQPLNSSKDCGALVRIAPVGLFGFPDPLETAVEIAAVTHGHPTGYLTAGFLATLVAELRQAASLDQAIEVADRALLRVEGAEETFEAVGRACDLAARVDNPTPEDVETLGAGWDADEALAISLFCALSARSFQHGVVTPKAHRAPRRQSALDDQRGAALISLD
jgi:ADP-ribosyl-[dinitrogen reductase] hydrolase